MIAIGDELLDGFTLDTNTHWMAERLRLLGHPLLRRTTVRDRLPDIAATLARDLADPGVDDVFCSGGLGPTPDDRTFAAVAEFLGRELVVEPGVLARITERVGRLHLAGLLDSPEPNEGNLRMARIPAGSDHVFRNRAGMAPGLLYRIGRRRLFILPGVPRELRGIFSDEIEEHFVTAQGGAVVREARFRFVPESRMYPVMRELERTHPDVSVGSYPHVESRELVIRCIGADQARVDEAVAIVERAVAAL